MAQMHQVYELTITTLSPLHIGTGVTLRRGFDYVTHGNRTWRIDADRLAEMLYTQDPSEFERMAQGVPAGQLIRSDEFDPASPLFRYVMRGEPQSSRHGSEVQELLKDPWDRSYIPGSSLKGALRTALAFVGWAQRDLRFSADQLRGSAANLALPLERQVLNARSVSRGKEPNHDLLRALQVGDSSPDDERRLMLANVSVATPDSTGSPIELEAVRRQTTFTATLTLDGFLTKKDTAARLGWEKDQRLWLKNLPVVVNGFSKPRIATEAAYWARSDAPIRSFYSTLVRIVQTELDEQREFLLQLGWGGGWHSKTLGEHLTADAGEFADVMQRYGRQLVRQGKYRRGDPFPKSRRVVMQHGKRRWPLGWVQVRMERIT